MLRTWSAAIRYMKRSVITGNTFAKNAWPNIRLFDVSLSRVCVQTPTFFFFFPPPPPP